MYIIGNRQEEAIKRNAIIEDQCVKILVQANKGFPKMGANDKLKKPITSPSKSE